MAWLRKAPMYSVALVVLAALIGGAALGYYAYVTFSSTTISKQRDLRGIREPYVWNGQRLLLQSVSDRLGSTCMIRGLDGAQRSVTVPLNSTRGMFNAPDFAEVAPQPGTTATITCTQNVKVFAGDAAVDRARAASSDLARLGVPALMTILVLAAIGIPALRSGRRS